MISWYPLIQREFQLEVWPLIIQKSTHVDKFILDGRVYVARLGSASLKIVQNKKREKETLEKLILHDIVRLFASGDAKCLNQSTGTFSFFIIFN